jgi:hypothetical protein
VGEDLTRDESQPISLANSLLQHEERARFNGRLSGPAMVRPFRPHQAVMSEDLSAAGSCRGLFVLLQLIVILSFTLFLCLPSLAQPIQNQVQGTNELNPPGYFSEDYYKVNGSPNLVASMESSTIYQGEETSLFITLSNQGRIESFKANNMPDVNRQDEILAAQKELELEGQRTNARDISLRLIALNQSAMRIKREVAYAGSLQAGQVSFRLEFPMEVYENTEPGVYRLAAVPNYTYQRDVAVVANSDRPQNPDVYYWYDSASQEIPLSLLVERKSDAVLKALNVTPGTLNIGSKDNIVKIFVENQGTDVAKDLVARLRPETGIYVDMDESPIPVLEPGKVAILVYKVDVSKDAVGCKPYQFTLLFDYSDSYRKNLEDSDNVYLNIEPSLGAKYWWAAAIATAVVLLAAIIFIRRRRRAAAIDHPPQGVGHDATAKEEG